MRNLILVTLLMLSCNFVFSQQNVRLHKGECVGTYQRDIGWNGGVGQLIISSDEAKSVEVDWGIINDQNGYNVFTGSSPIGISTHTMTGVGTTDKYGRKRAGYILYPGAFESVDGIGREGLYGICPISSSTIFIKIYRLTPAQ